MKLHHWIVFLTALIYAGLLVAMIATDADQKAFAQESCAGVPPPAPLRDTVLEPNAPKYTGPACMDGETCVDPPDWDTRVWIDATTVRHTFTYVGELRAVQRSPTEWESEELVLVNKTTPPCWVWEWRKWEP